jgi:hypothetical protein
VRLFSIVGTWLGVGDAQGPHDNVEDRLNLAVEIDGDDIQLIEKIERSMGLHALSHLGQLPARAAGPLAKRLYKRVGAAKAAGNLRGVPLLVEEIEVEIEFMVRQLSWSLHDEGRKLLNRLYIQIGEAEATYTLGGHRVWAPIVAERPAIEGP